jgi:enamine deaminase RidA (YjgF/YER057c/UK114 family)
MADTKISALPASTTPLAGTEVLPIVQSSTTRQVSVANLTAGRAISATAVTASTGNFIVGTSGQGIDFSATPGTGTSELFADYEEGTFTATLTCTSGTITLNSGQDLMQYTKIGRMVYVSGQLGVSSVSLPSGILNLAGLPFTISGSLGELAGRGAATVVADTVAATIVNVVGYFVTGGTTMTIAKYAAGVPANMAGDVSASSSFFINMQYVAA